MNPMLLLTRLHTDDQGTDGKLYLTSIPDCTLVFCTMELPYRNNQPDLSCIDIGDIDFTWVESTPKHPDGVYQGQKDGRTAIEIHIANYGGDQTLGWATDLDGCIGLGLGVAPLLPDPAKYPYISQPPQYQKAVFESTVAYGQFLAALNKQPFTLKIVEQFEEQPSST